jgi:hypothetical protein
VKTEVPGQDPVVLTPKLDHVNSLVVDAFDLKKMASDFGYLQLHVYTHH